MNNYISCEAAIEYLMTNMGWNDEDGYPVYDADEKRKIITDLISGIPVANVIDGNELFKCIAGHSYYSGNDILTRISVMQEGKHPQNGIPAADVRPVPPGGIGEMSDGYHTFNGLYYQRMVLFAELVKQNKDSAWKSHRHEDGELCFGGGWFIVGIDTPKGSYTYHYEDKDWDLFDCEELPVGKNWDGHTEDDVTRLLSLPEMRPVVLCRDCKHFNPYPGDCTDGCIEGVCKRHNSIGVLVMDDDFCSDAERI